jgi:hypothetical protein
MNSVSWAVGSNSRISSDAPLPVRSARGYSLSTLLSRGFAFVMLQRLVGAGLAVAQRDAVGLSKTKVPYLRITEAEGDRGMTPGAPTGSQRQQSGQCRHEDQA